MNFANMPELHWAYGYPAVIVLSALIVGGCILLLQEKTILVNENALEAHSRAFSYGSSSTSR